MFPSSSSYSARAAFARPAPVPPVSRRHRSYAALRLLAPSASALVPLAFGLPRPRALILFASCLRPQTHVASGTDHRHPASPDVDRGETRFSQVSGSSLSYTPRAKHHARCAPFSPIDMSGAPSPSEPMNPWAPGRRSFSGLTRRGSHARLPTHRRTCRQVPSQGSLPSGRARPSRTGFTTRWTTNQISEATHASSFWTSLAWSRP